MQAEGAGSQDVQSTIESLFGPSVLVEGLTMGLTQVIHEDFVRRGGHAIILPGRMATGFPSVLLLGTLDQLQGLCQLLSRGGDEEKEIQRDLVRLLGILEDPHIPPLVHEGKRLDFSGRPLLMGILNVTPDSFSDGGRYLTPGRAIARGLQMADEGADLLDIGGESTRPGSDAVSVQIQLERVLPVIEGIRNTSDVWISVDTYRSEVAGAAIAAGADMINDISGARYDPEIVPLAAHTGVPLVLMHIRGNPKNMQRAPSYQALISELLAYFDERIQAVAEAGVPREKVILDPGIGFGKTVEHNMMLLKYLAEFRVFGRPILLGPSRKSFIGSVLNRDVDKRLIGSLVTAVLGYYNGVDILRVHDVSETKEALSMAEAVRAVGYM